MSILQDEPLEFLQFVKLHACLIVKAATNGPQPQTTNFNDKREIYGER